MFKLRQRIRAAAPELTAISYDESEVYLLGITWQDARPGVCLWERQRINGDIVATLKRLCHQFSLDVGKCTAVLNPQDYRLLITEEPAVPKEEMRGALRWRIKDLIDMPVQDVTLDIFDMPQLPGSSTNSIYVVAAKNSAIQLRVDIMNAAGINLQYIDIPEMALRNIAAVLPEDDGGLATLILQQDQGLVLITRQKTLYLSRAFSVGSEIFNESMQESVFNQIVLELQRSMDYVESRFRQPSIRHVAIDPITHDTTNFPDFLRTNLGVNVIKFDPEAVIDKKVAVPSKWQTKDLLLFGAALRREV